VGLEGNRHWTRGGDEDGDMTGDDGSVAKGERGCLTDVLLEREVGGVRGGEVEDP
jgi:hypothetical protein